MKQITTLLCFLLIPFCVFGKKPVSKVKGVQIGTITYSYRSMQGHSISDVLEYTVASGVSSVELMGDVVENYMGKPSSQGQEAVKEWRKNVSMQKAKEIKAMFNKRGVKIHILKMADASWSDEEIDYAFSLCKVLGAKGLTMEIDDKNAKRLAPFAEKHKLYVILHNHGQPGNPNFSFDHYLSYGSHVMLNLDVGHYFGATGVHPNELITRLHDRIFSLHLKDKTAKIALDPDKNRPFGEGDTPLTDILQLIKKEKWPIYCDIELEYGIPSGSDAVKEVGKCVEYCREILLK